MVHKRNELALEHPTYIRLMQRVMSSNDPTEIGTKAGPRNEVPITPAGTPDGLSTRAERSISRSKKPGLLKVCSGIYKAP